MVDIPEDEPTKTIRDPKWLQGESVTILTYAGVSIRKPLKDALVTFEQDSAGVRSMHYTTGAAGVLKLHAAIVDWTLLYPSGKPVPFVPANIDRLPEGYADFIIAEIDACWNTWATATAPQTTGTKREDAKSKRTFQPVPTAAADAGDDAGDAE